MEAAGCPSNVETLSPFLSAVVVAVFSDPVSGPPPSALELETSRLVCSDRSMVNLSSAFQLNSDMSSGLVSSNSLSSDSSSLEPARVLSRGTNSGRESELDSSCSWLPGSLSGASLLLSDSFDA